MKYLILLAYVVQLSGSTVNARELQYLPGKQVYERKCQTCHSPDLKGNLGIAKMFKVDRSVLDLTKKETQDKTDAELKSITLKGRNKMPPQEDKITASELDALINYIRLFKGE